MGPYGSGEFSVKMGGLSDLTRACRVGWGGVSRLGMLVIKVRSEEGEVTGGESQLGGEVGDGRREAHCVAPHTAPSSSDRR